jgi:hypothetical protein
MSDLNELIDEETEASELGRDAEPTAATKVSRPNRNKSKVFSVRLSESEMAALQEIADKANLAASTLARSLIVSQLSAFKFETPAAVAAVQEMTQQLAASMPPPAIFEALAAELTKQIEPVQRQMDELQRALAESLPDFEGHLGVGWAKAEKPEGAAGSGTPHTKRTTSRKPKKRAAANP